MNGAAADIKVSDLDGEAPESTDFANYFCAYAYIYHQVRATIACENLYALLQLCYQGFFTFHAFLI
jgi:hypothetical protein